MTEEAYTLMETNRDRAIVKNSAFKRVTGRHTNGGSFGVEGKPQAELNALNGPVLSMDPRKFYTWQEFKALAPNLQIEYLEKLVFRYNIGLASIATEQFGLSSCASLVKHMTRNIDPNYRSPNRLGFKSSKAGREKYLNDMAEAWCPAPAEEPAPAPELTETAETEVETPVEETNAMDTMTNPAPETFAAPETPAADIHMNIRMNGLDMNLLTQLCAMLRNYPKIPVNLIIGKDNMVIGREMNKIIGGENG